MKPFAVAIAPTGARRTKQDHPAMPVSVQEIAAEAKRCVAAGATVLHLHVRDGQGQHTLATEAYRTATQAVRKAVGDKIIVQATTEAVGRYTPAEQMALVRELRPEAVSIAVKEMVPEKEPQPEAATFYAWTARERIAVQHILYSAEEAVRFRGLVARGVMGEKHPHVLFVLGRYHKSQQSEPIELLPFLANWPADWPWSVCAFGALEARCMATACALGGHARVGFENNFHKPDGSTAVSNADLVANLAVMAPTMGRTVATIDEARRIYGV
ncbi:MAG TPA: 3-keto-5-aminohexanoate cleavage protein [Candidatus Xenobia bacterium]